ncbi:S8 family serine peptidase [Paenibacillus sp. strain BS8-2]
MIIFRNWVKHTQSNSMTQLRHERLTLQGGARRLVHEARGGVRRSLFALLLASVALAGLASASPAPARAAQPAAVLAAGGAASAAEQPQSWLLRWDDPAQAHELRGTEVLRRQPDAAVEVVRPAASAGEDVEAWLRRLRGEPGVAYVHPSGGVHVLAEAAATSAASGSAPAEAPESHTWIPGGGGQETSESADVPDSDVSDFDVSYVPDASDVPDSDVSNSDVAAAPASTPDIAKAAARQQTIKANDPELAKQAHLALIGAEEAWKTVRDHSGITIALIDTGVDLDHPDLKNNLVEGVNLVERGTPPEDDNGHGTSVAGVLAASGNNGVGVSGVLWNAKLMPIKALDEWGDGTEEDLGEAILYAVKKGARIVVLSVGLHRESPYMRDIVNYAEKQGVLLVAAAGNDGVTLGSKASVKYPAAYPTVLAVGGARADRTADPRSNPGSELDLMAPWNVYTTALGGGYKYEEGSSMAAPQAAAAAALVMAQNPTLKPHDVRELLRQTARDMGPGGFDNKSGYGLLQVGKAVTAVLSKDAHEPNNSSATAAVLPIGAMYGAALNTAKDEDWYTVDIPYDGKFILQYEGLVAGGASTPAVRIGYYEGGKLVREEDTKLASKSIEFKAKKGRSLVKVQFSNPAQNQSMSYTLTTSLVIAEDAYEPNDQLGSAYSIQPRSGSISGTFHKQADRDWFVVDFKQSGQLQLSVSTNTARIDPGLSLQKDGQALTVYDDRGEGASEETPVISVTPGKYYIRIHNGIALDASPVLGTYTLKLDFLPALTDPNEPNDKSYEGLLMKAGTEYVGVIDKINDIDWFQFRLTKESTAGLTVTGVPEGVKLKLEYYDKRMKLVGSGQTEGRGSIQTRSGVLATGVYYVKITANQVFQNDYYRVKLKVDELVAGFQDISNHWAKDAIVSLKTRGIINGASPYRFEPDRTITRAEAVTMVVKAYNPIVMTSAGTSLKDAGSHWAKDAIAKAVAKGWVKGYPDGTFKPDEPITRAEMAIIIGNAEGLKTQIQNVRPFYDVSPYDWYAPMLAAMKQDGKLTGVGSNLYKPNETASRASFATLLNRYV